jgi:hypothetical protein
MLFRAFVINVEISTNRLTPYLSEDQDSSYYQLLQPLGGFTKEDDVPLPVRMEQHSKVFLFIYSVASLLVAVSSGHVSLVCSVSFV